MKKFLCTRCGHMWYPRNADADGNPIAPAVCPKCHSPYWRAERRARKQERVTRIVDVPNGAEQYYDWTKQGGTKT